MINDLSQILMISRLGRILANPRVLNLDLSLRLLLAHHIIQIQIRMFSMFCILLLMISRFGLLANTLPLAGTMIIKENLLAVIYRLSTRRFPGRVKGKAAVSVNIVQQKKTLLVVGGRPSDPVKTPRCLSRQPVRVRVRLANPRQVIIVQKSKKVMKGSEYDLPV
jgi:hypothetical protein